MTSLRLLILLAVLAAAPPSCTVVQTKVLPRDPALERTVRKIPSAPDSPKALLTTGRDTSLETSTRVAALVQTAKLTLPGTLNNDPEDEALYDSALRELVHLLQKDNFQNVTFTGAAGLEKVTVQNKGRDIFDPRPAEFLMPASQVKIRGKLERMTRPGFGVPYVAWMSAKSPALRGEPGVPPTGMAFTVTAVLAFHGREARLEFIETLNADSWKIAGRKVDLAADYTAPLALLLSKGKNRAIDIAAFLRTSSFVDSAALVQLQPYDPQKIPVVFVHGLLSRPEAWAQATNTLLADATIREHYQFWFFQYPTGLPVTQSSLILRRELTRFDTALSKLGHSPVLDEKILVGHSMGGLISSLSVRKAGINLWRVISDKPYDPSVLRPEIRKSVEETIFFEPRTDVSRVVFMATPHRGSPLALRQVAGFFANLIRLPLPGWYNDRFQLFGLLNDEFRQAMTRPANSILFLKANSPVPLSILKLPLAKPIPLHTILGDRGRPGPLERSSDGVVPYWSSHLEEAVSEKAVPSGHGVNENPEGIAELQRILDENVEDAR